MKNMTGSLAGTIGNVNPIRYRSYYFDSEINMYYLNSRYYNPDLCRFLNADGIVQSGQGLLDKNMFSYCGNDPVNYSDSAGTMREWVLDGITYVYNGTASDFHRLEQGLSPISYERALEKKKQESIILASEHHKKGTTNKSNQEKHEGGQARKRRDNNGERKNKSPNWKPNPNKRRPPNIEINIDLGAKILAGTVVIGATVAVVYFVANDFTGIGVADDIAIAPLLPIIWDNVAIVFA